MMCAFWISVEVTAYFFLIFSAILYLFTIQCSGIFGNSSKTSRAYLEQRYKYDALDFYKNDIEWFSLCFIIMGIHLNGINLLKQIQKGNLIWYDASGHKVTDTSKGQINLTTVLVGRLI
jgi:hypothetical protein